MLESFEHDVICWLPDNTEQKSFAVLKFEPSEGVTIKISGNLALITRSSYPIIHCATLGGTRFTLYDNEAIHIQGMFHHAQVRTYASSYLLEGIHCDKEVKFNEFFVSYAYLEDWLDTKTMQTSFTDNQEGETITYINRDPIKSETNNGKLSIYPTHLYSWHGRPESIELRTDWKVQFKLDDTTALVEFLSDTDRKLRNFLTLALDIVPYHLSITGYSDEHLVQIGDKKTHRQPIHIYFAQGDRITTRKVNNAFIIVLYEDLKDDFCKHIKAWYKAEERFAPIYDLYFGVMNNGKMYLIHAFLSFIQALEVYHRKSTGQEKTLKDALLDIMNTKNAFFGRKAEDLAEELKNTRHYLTHYNDKQYLYRIDLSSKNLSELVNLMKLMLQKCFFQDMDLDPNLTNKLLQRSYNKQHGHYTDAL